MIEIGNIVQDKLFGKGEVIRLNMSGPIVKFMFYPDAMCVPEYKLKVIREKSSSEYKESIYQKGYDLYRKGMELKAQARQVLADTGNVPAQLVEKSSDYFRKSALLANAARRAEG